MPLSSFLSNFPRDSVPAGLAILSLAVTIGLAIGSIRIRGVRLGVSGVLFSALIFGQLNLTIDPKVLQFLRDFALILFMYTIGLQVGPGFISSLRAEALRLNPLSVILALRKVFAIRIADERKNLAAAEEIRRPPIEVLDFEVTQPTHAGKPLRDHPLLRDSGIVLSRILRDGVMTVPTAATLIQ